MEMIHNQITFFVPTFNNENTISQCINAILEINPRCLFIVDNESTDKTLEIIRRYQKKNSKNEKKTQIKIFQHDKGLAHARNLGLKHCKTKYIAYVDSDCVINKNWLRECMHYFDQTNKYSKVAGVGGALREKYTKTYPDKWRSIHLRQHWDENVIENPPFLFGCNMLFKTSILKELGGFSEEYLTNYEDVEISKRIKKQGFSLIYEPKAKVIHHKQDTFFSVIVAARRWSFYSYQEPNTIFNLLKRVFLYNLHWCFHQLKIDFNEFKLGAFLTISSFFYFGYYDARWCVNYVVNSFFKT